MLLLSRPFFHLLSIIVMVSSLYSCASLRKMDIEVPKDIEEKVEIKEAPKDKQTQEKELKIVQHTISEEKDTTKQSKAKTISSVPKIISKPKVMNNPFKVGEKIRLDLKYIYKVYDVIDTYVDFNDFVPLKMKLKMDESKQNVSMVLIYDHKKGKSTFWKKRIDSKDKVEEIKRQDDIVPYAQDIFSALYFVRTHEFKVGDKLKFVVHDNGKNWNMTISAVRREKIWTRLGDVETIVLVPTVEREGEVFTKGSMSLWVTTDERRVPVKFEAEVRIGTMKGIIKDYIEQ